MQNHIQDFGRPSSATPTDKTIQNREVADRADMKRLAVEMALGLHFHFNHAEETDVARILHYGLPFLRQVRREPRIFYDGFWHAPDMTRDGGRTFVGAASSLLHFGRARAIQDLPKELESRGADDRLIERYINTFIGAMRQSARHRSEIARNLIQRPFIDDRIEHVRSGDFNRFSLHRVVPTMDGFFRLQDEKIVERAHAMEYMLTDLGWEIPSINLDAARSPSTPEARFMKDTIERRWGADLMRRIAAALLMTSKDIPIIAAHPDAVSGGSDTGKSTLMDCLSLAFPGMVGITADSRNLRPGASNFSQHTAPLTRELVHFYDEVDKVDVIRPGLLNSLTADMLTIELKRENPRVERRIGTPIFVIGGAPSIDSTAQGISSRLPAVFHFLTAERLTQRGRYALEDDSAIAYLRAWVASDANSLIAEEVYADRPLVEIVTTPETRDASKRLLYEMKPDVDVVFDEHFTEGEYADFTLTDTIHSVLKEAGVERPDDKKIRMMTNRVSPQSTPDRVSVNGKRGRGYRFLRQYQ